jgi:hypothetical protein
MTTGHEAEYEAKDLGILLDLLGKPPLLKGEDQHVYNILRSTVETMIKPKTIRDHMDVRDITDKIWEGHRYKRYSAKLLENNRINALAVILTPYCDYDADSATTHARNYFGANAEKRKLAARLLKIWGITDDMIYAQALAHTGSKLLINDRLVANRETSRRALFRDHERLAREADKAVRAKAEAEHGNAAPGREDRPVTH